MNQYFSVGETVIRRKTGCEHVVTGVILERKAIDPINNHSINITGETGPPYYHLDELAKPADFDENITVMMMFRQEALTKKNDPAEDSFTEDFTTLMDKLNQPVTA